MTSALLAETLNDRLSAIEFALSRIRQRQGTHTEARKVRSYLMDVLDLVQRNSEVDAAVDDLHRSVCAFVEVDPREGDMETRRGLLAEAQSKFLDRLKAAGVRIIPANGRDGLG